MANSRDPYVLHGTCGWSDPSIQTCGKFYPAGIKNAEQRLAHYSRHFPCVEVDSSTYAIPRPATTAAWVKQTKGSHVCPLFKNLQTPSNFKFHFKAYGLFTNQSIAVNALPGQVRHLLQGSALSANVPLSALPAGVEGACWQAFHDALAPVRAAHKMGAVVFQFQLSFRPSPQNREYVVRCRQRLDPGLVMAVEFRNRAWFSGGDSATQELVSWLSQQKVCLVAADELEHETYQKDREQTGLPPGQVREVLHIALHVTLPSFGVYVRVHRRHGTRERVLSASEIQEWAERLCALAPQLSGQGHIHFLWGTDWEDAPIVNAAALDRGLPAHMRWDQRKAVAAEAASQPHTLRAMLARMPRRAAAGDASTRGASPPAGGGGSAGGQAEDQDRGGGQQGEGDAAPPGGAKRRRLEAGEGECTQEPSQLPAVAAASTAPAALGPPPSGRQGQQQPGGEGGRGRAAGTQRSLHHFFTAKPPEAVKQTHGCGQ